MTRLYLSLLSVVTSAVAFAADGAISGPIAGYVADSTRTQLRAILGVPGAYTFSDPFSLPDGAAQVYVANGADFALLTRTEGPLAVLRLSARAVDRVLPVDGGMSSADWISFSPSARSAMLFSSSAHRMQVVTGLPGDPRIALDQDAAMLPEQPALGAVSDDASLVLMASATTVYRLLESGQTQVLQSLGAIQSLTVLRNGVDIVASDSSTGSVHVLQDAATRPRPRLLASGLEGIGPIFPSSDGRSVVVAQSAARTLASIDLATSAVQSFDSPAEPLQLMPLRNRDTFLIASQSNEPAWVFYREGAAGQVVFIPAAQ